MNIAPEHLAALQSYGYTVTEARFLYIVATHAGYFTQQQFLRFAGAAKGGTASRFVEKLLGFGHGRCMRYRNHTFIYNVFSRLVYGVIGKDNLRNRRRLANELIRIRLLILDFVLANLQHYYLETEADKLAYFHHRLNIPLPIIPGRIYKGLKNNSHTKRYFVDRFPIFISCGSGSLFTPLAPTFVYYDCSGSGLLHYIAHLRSYEHLFNRLSTFTFIYAAPDALKFKRAAKLFSRLFGQENVFESRRVLRYFEVRKLWESRKTNALMRSDRELLRDGDKRYGRHLFQAAYERWLQSALSPLQLETVCREASQGKQRHFATYVLSNSYDLFERVSKGSLTLSPGTATRNPGSSVGSSRISPTVESN